MIIEASVYGDNSRSESRTRSVGAIDNAGQQFQVQTAYYRRRNSASRNTDIETRFPSQYYPEPRVQTGFAIRRSRNLFFHSASRAYFLLTELPLLSCDRLRRPGSANESSANENATFPIGAYKSPFDGYTYRKYRPFVRACPMKPKKS